MKCGALRLTAGKLRGAICTCGMYLYGGPPPCAFVSQARAATMLELDVVTEIFDAGQGVRRLQLARLSHDNHEEDKAPEERTVKAASKRKTVERQRGSAKAPLVNDDISRQADRTDDPYEDNDLGTEWRRGIDPNGRMKNRPKC
jgi:hypothetical protein